MTIRTATASSFDRSIDALQKRQVDLANSQEHLTSGRRINRLSDDPLGAAEAEQSRSHLKRLDIEKRMVGFAKTMLNQAEGALSTAQEVLQSTREGLLQASNSTLNASDRASIAQQLRAAHDELLAIANRPDGSGGYIFGGQGTTSAPFSVAGSVVYTPQPGEQTLATDPAIPVTQDGRDTFMDLPSPGGPQSIFTTLTNAIAVLENPAATTAQVQAGTAEAINGVDAALERFSLKRTQIGQFQRTIESREALIASGSLEHESRIAELVGVDYAKAITELQMHQTAMDAAMRSYAQISRQSLFDYL